MEVGASLSFPIIPQWQEFLRGHIFVNAGHASLYQDSPLIHLASSLRSIYSSSASNPSSSLVAYNAFLESVGVSLGYGVMVKVLGTARLEMNFSVPLLKKEHYRTHDGIQIGLGVEFL